MFAARSRKIRRAGTALATAACCALAPAEASAATSAALKPCTSQHWVAAWASAPSDATDGLELPSLLDPSDHLKLPVNNETLRAMLTPSYGGSTIRIHLSNRYGTSPVTFAHVTVALAGAGAALAGPATTVTFGGSDSVTVAPGADVVSDATSFDVGAMQTLAVSMYVPGDAGAPTEHYAARQTSYYTPSGQGDHTTDTDASAFLGVTTDRDYVDGIDVRAPRSAGAVVALGDSLTDGYQGEGSLGIPEATDTLNTNSRWPDDLARRLQAANIPLSVLNEGISGDRVLTGGGPADATYALDRLSADVLNQRGATTVIWMEGINDIGGSDPATAAQLEAGWTQGIAAMHARGLTVLQGTLTPAGGARGAYGTAATNSLRQELNTWIRTQSPADGVVDFDAAVRNSSDTALNPAYDDGDHLHMNAAGYQAMADAISLATLTRPSCSTTASAARAKSPKKRKAAQPSRRARP